MEKTKEQLEKEKLGLEIKNLGRPYYKQPNFLAVLVAALGILIPFLTGIITGYLDLKNAKAGFDTELDSIKAGHQVNLDEEEIKYETALDSVNEQNRLNYQELSKETQKLMRSIASKEEEVDELKKMIADLRKENGSLELDILNGLDLSLQEVKVIAESILVEPAALAAAIEVETIDNGFLDNGELRILFEGHIFWKQLKKKGLDPKDYLIGNENILFQRWTKRFYEGGEAEYARLNKAARINKEAAYVSASWGPFQTMGFHYEILGFDDVFEMITTMKRGAKEQVELFVKFLEVNGVLTSLRRKKWDSFAQAYNGPAFAQNKYDVKLEKAYQKYLELYAEI